MTASDIAAFLDGIRLMQLQREDIAGAVVVIVKKAASRSRKGMATLMSRQEERYRQL
jgi:hypothetical protein